MTTTTRESLKIQALTERIAALTAEYENQVADLRVELTIVVNELNQLKEENVQEDETSSDE